MRQIRRFIEIVEYEAIWRVGIDGALKIVAIIRLNKIVVNGPLK